MQHFIASLFRGYARHPPHAFSLLVSYSVQVEQPNSSHVEVRSRVMEGDHIARLII